MYQLLQQLCGIYAPAGDESLMTQFVLNHVRQNMGKWKVKPIIHEGDDFQGNVILVFGKPTTAVFAHIDSIGFTVRYNNEVVKLGGPRLNSHTQLWGKDSQGDILTELQIKENKSPSVIYDRNIEPGTNLVYTLNYRETDEYIQSCYLDNRLGVLNALLLAETLENGIIVFSTWEETGGGAVPYLGKFIYQTYGVKQAIISDITWVTEGVVHGKGVAISIRDRGVPRRTFVNKIIAIAKESQIPYQLEVEASGGSDGNQLQESPYPFDWCFVGAPEDNVHTPDEKVYKKDFEAMLQLYQILMKKL